MATSVVVNDPNASMHKELAAVKAGKANEAEELPKGASAVAEGEETTEVEAEVTEETSASSEGDAEGAVAAAAEPEEEIRIGSQTFKSTKEAVAYAEAQERERELERAHTAGLREAIEAQSRSATPAPVVEEEDIETELYTNPKGTLEKIRARAVAEAVNIVKAEKQKEEMWNDFLSENPDIRRKDAERILSENMDTIGKLEDIEKGKKALAAKVRAEYAEIGEMLKPRTALSTGKAAISPSGGTKSGVTPTKQPEKILSFSEQVRRLKG